MESHFYISDGQRSKRFMDLSVLARLGSDRHLIHPDGNVIQRHPCERQLSHIYQAANVHTDLWPASLLQGIYPTYICECEIIHCIIICNSKRQKTTCLSVRSR